MLSTFTTYSSISFPLYHLTEYVACRWHGWEKFDVLQIPIYSAFIYIFKGALQVFIAESKSSKFNSEENEKQVILLSGIYYVKY